MVSLRTLTAAISTYLPCEYTPQNAVDAPTSSVFPLCWLYRGHSPSWRRSSHTSLPLKNPIQWFPVCEMGGAVKLCHLDTQSGQFPISPWLFHAINLRFLAKCWHIIICRPLGFVNPHEQRVPGIALLCISYIMGRHRWRNVSLNCWRV